MPASTSLASTATSFDDLNSASGDLMGYTEPTGETSYYSSTGNELDNDNVFSCPEGEMPSYHRDEMPPMSSSYGMVKKLVNTRGHYDVGDHLVGSPVFRPDLSALTSTGLVSIAMSFLLSDVIPIQTFKSPLKINFLL